MATTANEDWVKYAAEYEAAKLARENEMFVANEQYKSKRAQLLEQYSKEDKRAQGFLGRLTNRESDTEIAAKRATEAVALESEYKEKSQAIEEKYPQPTFKEWLVHRDASLARQTHGSNNTISNGEDLEPQPINSNAAKSLLDFEYRRGSRATKDEHHIHYHPRGDKTNIAFTDTGKNIEIYEWEKTESLLASLQLASQKWDKLRIDGDDAYKAECVKLAVEHGFKISNPELQDAIRLGVEEKARLSVEREEQLKADAGLFAPKDETQTTENQVTAQANLSPTEPLDYEEGMPTAIINNHKDENREFSQQIKIVNAMQGLSYGDKEPLDITKEIAWHKVNTPESDRIALLTSSSAIQGVLAKTTTNHDFHIASEYFEKQYEAIKSMNLSKSDVLGMDHEQLNELVKQQSATLTQKEASMPSTVQQNTDVHISPFSGLPPEEGRDAEEQKMERFLEEHPEYEAIVVRHPETGEPLKQESLMFVNEPGRKEMVSWESENDQWVYYQQDEKRLLITPFNEDGEVEGLMYSHDYTTGNITETHYEAGVKHGLEVHRNQIDWLKHDENFYEYGTDVTDAYVRSKSKLPQNQAAALSPEDEAALTALEDSWSAKPSDNPPEYTKDEVNQMIANVGEEANTQRAVIDHENDLAHNAAETAERTNIASAQTSQQKDAVVEVVSDIQADVRATKSEKTHEVAVEQKHAEQAIVKWTSKAPKGEVLAVDPFSDDPNHGKRKSVEQTQPDAPQNQAEFEHKRTNKR